MPLFYAAQGSCFMLLSCLLEVLFYIQIIFCFIYKCLFYMFYVLFYIHMHFKLCQMSFSFCCWLLVCLQYYCLFFM